MAFVIIMGQLPKLLGVEGGDGDFFVKLRSLVTELPDVQTWTVLLGVICLVTVLVLKRVAPLVPGSLVAVFLGIVAVVSLDLDDVVSPSSARSNPACPAWVFRVSRPGTWHC
jgi:MFS superfamily sulfate permease-like transporter